MVLRFFVCITVICWNFQPVILLAQEGIIRGIILDSLTKKALINATIHLRGTKKTLVSDNDGAFRFNKLFFGRYILDVTLNGYRSFSLPIILNTTITEVQIALLPVTLPEILVNESLLQTSGESTRQIHRLLHKEIEQKRGQTLGDLLTNVPGVTVLQTGASIAKPVIRGLHSQRVLVINAGIQQEGQQWGAEHAPEIDPFTPSRIEVLKGASALEHGTGAIGGVIKVFPRELPKSTPLYGQGC